ncbi:MAG TPA: hypothetical protein VGD54_15270 [Steroidobacteraceae bacterium]
MIAIQRRVLREGEVVDLLSNNQKDGKTKPLCFALTENEDLPSFRANMKALSCMTRAINGVDSPGAVGARAEFNSFKGDGSKKWLRSAT